MITDYLKPQKNIEGKIRFSVAGASWLCGRHMLWQRFILIFCKIVYRFKLNKRSIDYISSQQARTSD